MDGEEIQANLLDPTPPSRPKWRSVQDATGRRRRIIAWVVSIGLAVLFVNALVGQNGYLATVRADRERAALIGALARVRVENQHLQQEARRLQHDPAAVEEAARRDLGFVRPGEAVVIIRDAPPARPAAPSN